MGWSLLPLEDGLEAGLLALEPPLLGLDLVGDFTVPEDLPFEPLLLGLDLVGDFTVPGDLVLELLEPVLLFLMVVPLPLDLAGLDDLVDDLPLDVDPDFF